MYSNGVWDNSIVYKQDLSAITKAARADDSELVYSQGKSRIKSTLGSEPA